MGMVFVETFIDPGTRSVHLHFVKSQDMSPSDSLPLQIHCPVRPHHRRTTNNAAVTPP